MMVHGAYGPKNDDGELQGFNPGDFSQALEATEHLGAASMGSYTSDNRVTRWISHNILEEPKWEKDSSYVRNSYVYNWRAFSNTRNSSKNNAVELGDRACIPIPYPNCILFIWKDVEKFEITYSMSLTAEGKQLRKYMTEEINTDVLEILSKEISSSQNCRVSVHKLVGENRFVNKEEFAYENGILI